VPDAPEALQEIVSDALTKDPDARYQTAKQMLSKLQRLEQRLDSGARAAQPSPGASAAGSIGSVPPAVGAEQRQTTSGQSPAAMVSSISSAEYLVNQVKGHRAAALVVLVLLVLILAVSGSALYKVASGRQAAAKPGPEFTAMKITRLTDTGKAERRHFTGRWCTYGGRRAAESLGQTSPPVVMCRSSPRSNTGV
jgi:hypothetical protein